MPTYVYEREDGSQFEFVQSITEESLTECPDTGQKVKRVIQPVGTVFKGSGWYVNTYGNRKESNPSNSNDTKTKS